MKSRLISVIAIAALCLTATPVMADLTNGSFENSLNGWTVPTASTGYVTVETSHNNSSPTGSPSSWSGVDGGAHFALLTTHDAFSPVLMYQQFSVSSGDTLTLRYFFDVGSSLNDTASGVLFGQSGLPSNVFSVSANPGGDTDWLSASYTFTDPGEYSLLFQVQRNGLSTSSPSYLGIDAVSVVPVPAGILLGFLGLSAAGLGLRKLT